MARLNLGLLVGGLLACAPAVPAPQAPAPDAFGHHVADGAFANDALSIFGLDMAKRGRLAGFFCLHPFVTDRTRAASGGAS